MEEGFILIVSGAAGVGKGTVISELRKHNKNIHYSISCTTRAPRSGEVDGKDYYFISKERFEEMIEEGAFAEYAFVHTDYYGTPKTKVDEAVRDGKVVVLEIDVQGKEQLDKVYPDAITVFIAPPSFEILEQRLRNRGTESEEKIQIRLENAKKEMAKIEEYKYMIVNDDFVSAAKRLNCIITAEMAKTSRNHGKVTGEKIV